MTGNPTVSIAIIIAYFVFLTYFVFRSARMKENTMEEYAVAGRSFNWFFVLFTIVATLLVGSMFVGWFEWAAWEGLIAQYDIIYVVGSYAVLYVLAKRVWIWGKKHNLLSQPDFIQVRYGYKPLTIIFSIAAVVIEAPWTIMEFATLGFLAHAMTYGLVSRQLATIIIVAFILIYIYYSGMRAVIVTDLVQGIISSVVLSAGLIFVVFKLFGGFGPLFQGVFEHDPAMLTITYGDTYTYGYWSSIILSGALGMFAWSSMFNRIYAARSIDDVKKTTWIGAIICGIFSILVLVLAMGVSLKPDAMDMGETMFFYILNSAGGPVLMALGGIMVIAASMSLIDSVITSHGVIISENLIKYAKPNLTSEQRVKVSRIAIVIYVVIALAIALMDLPNLATIAIIMYEGILQVLPPLFFGLYWRRSNKYGAFWGLVVGLVLAITLAIIFPAGFSGWAVGFTALLANIVIHVVVSLVTAKDENIDAMFEDIASYNEELQFKAVQE